MVPNHRNALQLEARLRRKKIKHGNKSWKAKSFKNLKISTRESSDSYITKSDFLLQICKKLVFPPERLPGELLFDANQQRLKTTVFSLITQGGKTVDRLR